MKLLKIECELISKVRNVLRIVGGVFLTVNFCLFLFGVHTAPFYAPCCVILTSKTVKDAFPLFIYFAFFFLILAPMFLWTIFRTVYLVNKPNRFFEKRRKLVLIADLASLLYILVDIVLVAVGLFPNESLFFVENWNPYVAIGFNVYYLLFVGCNISADLCSTQTIRKRI